MSLLLDPRPSGLPHDAFVARYGGVYEHSPWVAEAVLAAGPAPDTPEIMASRMAAVVEAAGHDRQLILLRAHPELAGKLAMRKELTADSLSEQASARLDQCNPEEFARFSALNTQYNAKFGFPFVIAVRGLQRADILASFEHRVSNTAADEFRTALDQVHKIARLRLSAMTAPEND